MLCKSVLGLFLCWWCVCARSN